MKKTPHTPAETGRQTDGGAADRVFTAVRKLTVAPVLALLMLAALGALRPGVFGTAAAFCCAVAFLCVLPLLAYPLQRFFPRFRDKGREGQRTLAMLFAVAGYILGLLTGLIMGAPAGLMTIYAEYLLSGALIVVFNKLLRVRLSGHACGVSAPILLLARFDLWYTVPVGCVLTVLVYIASIRTGRHSLSQLMGGSLVPIAALLLIQLFFR